VEIARQAPQPNPAPAPVPIQDVRDRGEDAHTGEQPQPAAEHGRHAVSLSAGLASKPVAALVAIAGLIALVVGVFALMRQREQARLATAAARDLASLSLDDPPDPPPLVPTGWAGAAPHGAPRAADFGDGIPATLDEALEVLGMGVRAEASEVAIKKVVDGLRMSWHPDYASGPDDLALRELRTKQINAAWDIIRSGFRQRQRA
jgi:hypothetical protein